MYMIALSNDDFQLLKKGNLNHRRSLFWNVFSDKLVIPFTKREDNKKIIPNEKTVYMGKTRIEVFSK